MSENLKTILEIAEELGLKEDELLTKLSPNCSVPATESWAVEPMAVIVW